MNLVNMRSRNAPMCLAKVALVIRFAVRLRCLGQVRSPRCVIEKVLSSLLACPCCMQGRPAIEPAERREEHAVEVTSAGAFQCCLHAKSLRGWNNDPLRIRATSVNCLSPIGFL